MSYANITKGRLAVQREGELNVFPVAAGVTVYDGSLAYLTGGSLTYTPEAGSLFAGVAAETASDKAGVYSLGVFVFDGSFSAGDEGKAAYADLTADPGTVTVTAPGSGAISVKVGVVVRVIDETSAEVSVGGYALRETAAAVS